MDSQHAATVRADLLVNDKRRRLYGLDGLRGIAVFLMIEQHMGVWLWRGPARGLSRMDYPAAVVFNALGGMAAPLFVTLAGVGSALFVAAGRPRTDSTMVRRGIALMGFGVALNLLTPSWFTWASWFVLHMMGFAMALAPLWRRLSTRALLIACVLVLIASVAVQTWLETPIPLRNVRMRDFTLPGGVFRLGLAESQFPILPWLTFYLAGFVAGRWINDKRPRRVALLSLAFLVLGGGGHGLYRLGISDAEWFRRAFSLHLGFFPAPTAIVGLLLGGALLLIAFVFWLETRGRGLTANNPLVTLGRASLTLLILHVWLFREASRWVYVGDHTLWRGLSHWTAVGVIMVFAIVAAILSRFWQRVDYRFGAEWLLRKAGG